METDCIRVSEETIHMDNEELEKKEKHIDFCLLPTKGTPTERAVSDVVDNALDLDNGIQQGDRGRSRRADFQERISYAITLIVSNLIRSNYDPIRVPLSKRVLDKPDRYRGKLVNYRGMVKAVELLSMSGCDYITVEKGEFGGRFSQGTLTVLRATDHLINVLRHRGARPKDIVRSESEEVIVLKSSKDVLSNKLLGIGGYVNYLDIPFTNVIRDEMVGINHYIQSSDITYVSNLQIISISGGSYHVEHNHHNGTYSVRGDKLRRIFNGGVFTQGGRMYGGHWQSLKKSQRKGMTINGEPCVEVDFKAMGLSLLYAKAGLQLDFNTDPYSISLLLKDGVVKSFPREGIKKIVSAMMNVSEPFKRYPKGCKQGKGWSIGDARWETVERLILEAHAPVSHLLYTGVGLELMRTESDIMVSSLLELSQMGVVGLPIHDCVIVPHSASEEAQRVLLKQYQQHTGMEGRVEVMNLY